MCLNSHPLFAYVILEKKQHNTSPFIATNSFNKDNKLPFFLVNSLLFSNNLHFSKNFFSGLCL